MKTTLKTTVSLCERCKHRDWDKESDLQEIWAQIGRQPFTHVWCGAIDAPEDIRWAICPAFEGM